MHVVLFVMHAGQCAGQFSDHVLQFRVTGFRFVHGSDCALGSFSDVHREHDHLGRHGGHLIAEAVSIGASCMCGKSIFSGTFFFALVDNCGVWSGDFHLNVVETALNGLEH